ncbi:MAG: NERD domain-containing protein [Paludibacteraceae bacterium]|nr:NERD domain-containing protein [Paludibacteraceae bacterium]
MARMIPDYISREDPKREGERMVFEWLSNESIKGTAFYSVLQKNHVHKLIGEVDFLLVCDRGCLCIEVKGGKDIFRRDGKWYSVSHRDVENEIHNPFVQAKDCSYALKKHLATVYGKKSKQADYLIGYAVVFPQCRFTGSGNDLVTEVMFDARYDLDDFPRFISDTFDYWDKLEVEKHNVHPERLTIVDQKQLRDLLCGDFRVVPSMHLELQHVNQRMIELTEEQYALLEIIDENPKIVIQGSAGTGKTLLALQLVRNSAAKEKKVLYLCFNSNMSEYAMMSLDASDKVKVSTFHSLIMNALNDKSLFDVSVKELCRTFMRMKAEREFEKYDVIVVDEGQDLFLAEVFDVLDVLLKNGLENGEWAMFLDPNQNIFNPTEEYEQTKDYLKELCHPVFYPLTINCRNTQPIASRTAALTITRPAKNLKLAGPKVITRTYDGAKSLVSELRKELQSLLASGIPAEDIVVLSRYRKENSCLADVPSLCNLEIVENSNISSFKKRALNYYTAYSFKGLESRIVFFIDVDGFASVKDRMINYVAMSRALLQLYLFYDESKKEEYQETLDRGSDVLA